MVVLHLVVTVAKQTQGSTRARKVAELKGQDSNGVCMLAITDQTVHRLRVPARWGARHRGQAVQVSGALALEAFRGGRGGGAGARGFGTYCPSGTMRPLLPKPAGAAPVPRIAVPGTAVMVDAVVRAFLCPCLRERWWLVSHTCKQQVHRPTRQLNASGKR